MFLQFEFFHFLLNQEYLLRRNRDWEGPINISPKKRCLEASPKCFEKREIYQNLKSDSKRNKGVKKEDILKTVLLFLDCMAF